MNVLAIGSHPDDIEFGCGGTLYKYARSGHAVHMMIATEGGMGGDAALRRSEAEQAAEKIGVEKIYWGGIRDTELPRSSGLVAEIERVLAEVEPSFIFVHHREDTHQDHRALADAAIAATRHVRNVLFYEGPTTVNFQPNVFVDISQLLDRKLSILAAHASQVEKTNIPSLNILEIARAIAVSRGIQARTSHAEAFGSLRLFINIDAERDQLGAGAAA